MNDLIVMVGLVCLLAGGWMVSPAVALMVLGLILIVTGLTRIKGEQNGPH